jgi:hypothetical protein
MKTRQEFQLEIEDELAAIEQEIDEIRRQRREEEPARAHKNGAPPKTARPLILPGDDGE